MVHAILERRPITRIVHNAVRAALADIRAISAGLLLPELEGLTIREVIERAVRDHTRQTGTVVEIYPAQSPGTCPARGDYRPVSRASGGVVERDATRQGHRCVRDRVERDRETPSPRLGSWAGSYVGGMGPRVANVISGWPVCVNGRNCSAAISRLTSEAGRVPPSSLAGPWMNRRMLGSGSTAKLAP